MIPLHSPCLRAGRLYKRGVASLFSSFSCQGQAREVGRD